MMISEEMVEKLPLENRKKLVDYMEGLSTKTKNLIKMMLPKPYMDKSFFKTNKRKIYELSTLDKYLPKSVTVEKVSNPDGADYQNEYFKCIYDINSREEPFSSSVRYTLSAILAMDCYDIETLIKTEVTIGEVLNSAMPNECDVNAIAAFITNHIMAYKFRAYDFYTYLDINADLGLRESDYHHMQRIHAMIHKLMMTKSSLTAFSDIGVLVFIYYKDLGMEDYIQKYHLFDRFELTMYYLGIPEEYVQEAKDRMNECINSKLNITAAASILVNSNKLSSIDNGKPIEMPIMTGSPNIDESNGFIFSFKNIKEYDPETLDKLAVWLRSLTEDEILHYVDMEPNNLTFTLNENDIGHVKNENRINIGTAYNSSTKKIRYIIENDGEFYLLFKNRMNSRIVYGLSVQYYPSKDGVTKPRNLITIKENRSVYFKYIPEM